MTHSKAPRRIPHRKSVEVTDAPGAPDRRDFLTKAAAGISAFPVAARSAPLTISVVDRPADSRPAWVKRAPLLTWSTISNTKMHSVLLEPVHKVLRGTPGWCGAALRHSGSEIFMGTGGHTSGASNSIYSIALNQQHPTWVRRNEPTMKGLTQNAPYYEDGRPASRHTYWNIQFNQSRNLLMFVGGASFWGNGNATGKHVDVFDPVTNDYLPAGDASYFPDCIYKMQFDRPIVMDDNDNCYDWVYWGSSPLSRLDNESRTWTVVARRTPTAAEAGPQLLFDKTRNRLVRFDRHRPILCDLSNYATSAGPSYSGSVASRVRYKTSIVHVPKIGTVLDDKYLQIEWAYQLHDVGNPPIEVIAIDPDSFEATIVPIAGEKPTYRSYGNGVGQVYGRWMYVPELKILILHTETERDLRFIRLA